MGFDRPLALLLLALLPALLAGYFLARRRRARYTVRFTNLDVLRGVAPRFAARREWVVAGLLLCVVGLLCIAIARPHVNRMAASRLEAAKAAASTFLDRVPDRLRVGLVTFAGDATVAAVPTHDRVLLHRSVDAIDPFQSGGGGTAIGDALARSVELARDSLRDTGGLPTGGETPDENAGVTILFLSDGRQYRGILPPEAGAALAKQAGIPVFTVALGTDDPDEQDNVFGFAQSPDRETLRAIARTTGGEYFAARSAQALSSAYDDLGSRLGRAKRRTEVTFLVVAAAALALAGAVGLSRLWEPVLP